MERVEKSNICDYINSLLKDRCYVGLHSIVDDPTTNNNYLSNNKRENAISIMNRGLINSRGGTLNHTIRFFGDLSVASSEIKNKMSNYYQGINRSGEYYVEVVAIPYFFEDGLGRKIFGGYKEYDSESQFRERAECVTDALFSQCVPSEMILGYYSYDEHEKKVTFVHNTRYYSNLSIGEKQKFIQKYFNNYVDSLNINANENVSKMEDFIKRFPTIKDPFSNTLRQYISLKKSGLANSKNTNMNYSGHQLLEKTPNNITLQIEYPDGKIHSVNCYKFCKALLDKGEYVYFIEYKDKVGDKEIDSYAVLENHFGRFYKSDKKIAYNELASNVIRDIALDTLSSEIFMKNSERGIDMIRKDVMKQEEIDKANEEVRNEVLKLSNEGGSSNTMIDIRQKKDTGQKSVYVVLPTRKDNHNVIDFTSMKNTLFLSDYPISAFVHEGNETIEGYLEHSYTNNCKILKPLKLDKEKAERIFAYLREQESRYNFNVNGLEDVIIENYRCKFVPSTDTQYRLVSFGNIEKIYLPIKIGHDDADVKNMFYRYMNGTALGCSIINGSDFVTEPKISSDDYAKMYSLLADNMKLRNELNIEPIHVENPNDSYELDDTINRLKKENDEFELQSKMSPDELSQYNRQKEIKKAQAFSEFFSSMGVDTSQIKQSLEKETIDINKKSSR